MKLPRAIRTAFLSFCCAAALAGCGYGKPAGTEYSAAAYNNGLDGLTVSAQRTDLVTRYRPPMDHGSDVEADGIVYRTWRVDPFAGSGNLEELTGIADWRKDRDGGDTPGGIIATGGRYRLLMCGAGFGYTLTDKAINCAGEDIWPKIDLLGSRFAAFRQNGTVLEYDIGSKTCQLDLKSIDADAAEPIYIADGNPAIPEERSQFEEQVGMPRFGLAVVSANTVYLTANTQPGIGIYRLECSRTISLGTAFDAAEFTAGQNGYRVLDLVSGESPDRPTLLLSSPKAEGLYAFTVKRSDGSETQIGRLTEYDPQSFGDVLGQQTGFYGTSPDFLLTGAYAWWGKGKPTITVELYDIREGKQLTKTFDIPDSENWPKS